MEMSATAFLEILRPVVRMVVVGRKVELAAIIVEGDVDFRDGLSLREITFRPTHLAKRTRRRFSSVRVSRVNSTVSSERSPFRSVEATYTFVDHRSPRHPSTWTTGRPPASHRETE